MFHAFILGNPAKRFYIGHTSDSEQVTNRILHRLEMSFGQRSKAARHSPAFGLVVTERLVPCGRLLLIALQTFRMRCHGKGKIIAQGNLRKEQVDGIGGLQPQSVKHLLCLAVAGGAHTGSQ